MYSKLGQLGQPSHDDLHFFMVRINPFMKPGAKSRQKPPTTLEHNKTLIDDRNQ